MIKVVDDERLIAKVCDMYYNQNINQKTISEKLGLSRPTISRVIANGRERGIVRITVNTQGAADHFELERSLEDLFGLNEVIITETQADSEQQKDEAGKATAGYLNRIIRPDSIVGVSMGKTISHIAKFVPRQELRGTLFVPMIGGLGHIKIAYHSNAIAEELSGAFGGRNLMMHAPARVSSNEIRDEIMKDTGIAETIRAGEQADIAVVGIGNPNSESSSMASGYYSVEEIESLKRRHVVGDILMQFYDVQGNSSLFEKQQSVIGIRLEQLRQIQYSIGVACGVDKIDAIRGAAAGGYINTLITDVDTARLLLSDPK
ncbi:MAG: sugar-binding transcriptional regulator [Eubacteriaceae bacterium]